MRTEPPTGDELTRLLVSMKQNVLERAARDRPAAVQRPQRNDRAIGIMLGVAILLGLGAGGALALGLVTPPFGVVSQATPTPTPTPTPRPTPGYTVETAEPTPAPAPVDPLSTVTTLVATPEALELRDGSGGLVTRLDYLSDAAAAIATLEAVFGTAPVSEEYRGSGHFPPSTAHRWGGFEFWEQRYIDRWEGRGTPPSFHLPAFRVAFTAAASGHLDLTTASRHHVGDVWSDLMADTDVDPDSSACWGPYADFIDVPITRSDGSEHVARFAVDFLPSPDESSVARVRAPIAVEDGCA